MNKPNYFELGERVQVVEAFWFYDEHYSVGTVFIIEEEHLNVDFENHVIKAYL